jgi:hypothetical protein
MMSKREKQQWTIMKKIEKTMKERWKNNERKL